MSRGRSRLRERMTELGTQPAVEPSPAFTAGLERKLVGGAIVAGATVLALPSRHRGYPIAGASAAMVATVVLAGALIGVIGRGGAGALRLAAAVDTTVISPGGHAAPARSGQDLPNGSVVWTGPNGRASAGTVEIGPGLQAVVDAGRLRLSADDSGTAPVSVAPSLPVAVPTVPDHHTPPLALLPRLLPHLLPTTTTTTRTPPTTLPRIHSGAVTTTTTRPEHHRGR